jgi:hypothetical protein
MGKAQFSDFRKDADGRQRPSYLTRRPVEYKSQEMRRLARDKEEHFLRRAAEEFNQFITFNGQPDGFSLTPKAMELCELKMAEAARAGDQRLVHEIGEKYLLRVMAYLDMWRMRVAKRQQAADAGALELSGGLLATIKAYSQGLNEKAPDGAQTPAPLEVDSIEVRSTKIPKRLELEPGELPWEAD